MRGNSFKASFCVLDLAIVRVSIVEMKHQNQKQVGVGRVYLACTSTLWSITEGVRTGAQTGQEPRGRS